MALISSDTIRDISVKSVEMFLNHKIPLSQGLAKQASEYELNSEQIQRAVEATNSIAYLKVLELSNDRTIEFPLCKFAEVMTNIVVPDMNKQASLVEYKDNSSTGSSSLDLEKFAQYTPPTLSEHEETLHLMKQASVAERQLQQFNDRAITIVPELEKLAFTIKSDNKGFEKLATVVSGKEFSILSALVYGSVKEHCDTGIFKSAELKDAKKIVELYKEAKDLQSNILKCKDIIEKVQHVKQASIAGSIGSFVGKAIGSVASAPFKALKPIISNTAENIGSRASATGIKLKNTVTGQSNPIPKISNKKGVLAAGAALGAAAFDASIYQPGKTKNGSSKDVWDALQRS